ncbi:hypothetical protein [Komagataeibacter oboediens]|uniref:Uncharacterized protein n=1 Tax=Komagataeibacter oboediens TaxID=65958 RepID=A0ABS5SPM9_9PROT|nr:hypothetical protein [Komagataeibacter oboediens]MBL7233141.1 hypothetical protein [Komagataeibacter oboediens]MBT0675425.1 hypothetical protein [Komagataeibacter oboediens]MBT0679672.1 hypothetical protein [Komagataeibacter oboediens]
MTSRPARRGGFLPDVAGHRGRGLSLHAAVRVSLVHVRSDDGPWCRPACDRLHARCGLPARRD